MRVYPIVAVVSDVPDGSGSFQSGNRHAGPWVLLYYLVGIRRCLHST